MKDDYILKFYSIVGEYRLGYPIILGAKKTRIGNIEIPTKIYVALHEQFMDGLLSEDKLKETLESYLME